MSPEREKLCSQIHAFMAHIVPLERRGEVAYAVVIIDMDDPLGPLVTSTFGDRLECANILARLAVSLAGTGGTDERREPGA